MPLSDQNKSELVTVTPIVTEEDEDEGWSIKNIRNLALTDGALPSPIDINVNRTIQIDVPCLNWNYYNEIPKKTKITNTGETLILSAKWQGIRPFLSGGILNGKYVFSQLHFHWGKSALEGSSHSIDGSEYKTLNFIRIVDNFLC